MPLLATFLGSLILGLANFLGRWMLAKTAMSIAGYVVFIALVSGFTVSVAGCLSALSSYVQSAGAGGGGASWVSYFWMGLGMFIPANASAVMSCLATVWIGCQVFKMQKIGVLYWGRG